LALLVNNLAADEPGDQSEDEPTDDRHGVRSRWPFRWDKLGSQIHRVPIKSGAHTPGALICINSSTTRRSLAGLRRRGSGHDGAHAVGLGAHLLYDQIAGAQS